MKPLIHYVNTLAPDEIEHLDADLKANSWGVKSIVEIEDCIELLKLFQIFHYFNGRLPLTNGHLLIPDGETPDGSKKISLKILCKMFKDTESQDTYESFKKPSDEDDFECEIVEDILKDKPYEHKRVETHVELSKTLQQLTMIFYN